MQILYKEELGFLLMTSEERHAARDKRRRAKRAEKRVAKLSEFDNFEKVSDYNSLYRAYLDARKGVRWKTSVQRYGLDLSKNLCILHNKLIKGEDVRKGFIPFDLMERGKLRHIQSVHFSERIPQKSLSQNALVPVLGNSLIYDNGASRKGMGISHAINRTTRHLREYFRKYGNDGYILQIDLKDYFASIPHEPLKEMLREKFHEEQILKLTYSFIDAFAEDKMARAKKEGTILTREECAVGLGLGSEICQICAVAYPDRIDHYIKERARCRWYARYNDDSYVIHHSKEFLKELLDKIREMYKEMGIRLNEKKTKIVKLSRGFTFLKTKFILTKTGKVIKRLCHKSVVIMRRKLKSFAKFVQAGAMTIKQAFDAFQSWVGYAMHKNANTTVRNMKRLFIKLFGKQGGICHV